MSECCGEGRATIICRQKEGERQGSREEREQVQPFARTHSAKRGGRTGVDDERKDEPRFYSEAVAVD